MTRIDVHQHAWTPRLVAALAAREAPPRLRVGADGGWVLELAGEAPYALADVPPLAPDDADVAVLALSSALGVERLPGDEARELIAAWDADADAFAAADDGASAPTPARLAWGALPLADATPADVDAALARGRVGLSLPATELGSPAALDRLGPLLERLAQHDAPLLVHPGPVAAGTWLPPLTAYVAQLQAAWLAWVLHGRAQHPSLRVVFAALAGLAPLHAERLHARVREAAGAALDDERTFFDTSSYGPVAVDALLRVVGEDRLVLGSDRPYAAASALGSPLGARIAEANPAALLRLRPAAVAA